jgi:small nuclear ribonucleoprotein (snRNP)-like protein
MEGDPARLVRFLNERVEVQLSEVRGFRGVLVGFDKHLNIVLKEAEEMRVIDGESRFEARGLIILRGIHIQSVGANVDPQPTARIGQSAWQAGIGTVNPFARGSV